MITTATIFALSSGPGRAGVSVIRVSGPQAGPALLALAGRMPPARTAALKTLRRPNDSAELDRALVLWFPGPNSFTGEDCCEFHVHGGRAVVAGVIDALGRLPGLRLAEAGEFTRRAFENGKLDLTAAEGLSDLIDAETEAQRAQALRQMGGGLAEAAETWRAGIVRAMGLVEAAIDFSDEADVSERAVAQAREMIAELYLNLSAALEDGRRGEILRDGFTVVIAGPPNAGKSSLLNALSRRDVAIVSDEPGTTRDVVEARLDVGGVPVLFMDTAGIREAPGKVEREGIRRSLARAADADLVLWVTDGAGPAVEVPAEFEGLGDRLVRVGNKADLVTALATPSPPVGEGRGGGDTAAVRIVAQSQTQSTGIPPHPNPPPQVGRESRALSALTGEGVDELLALIAAQAGASGREAPLITRARHRALIGDAAAACRRFLDGEQTESELRAEDLRGAAHALGKLTGRVDVEEVLGEIFGRFCIGK